MGIICLVDNNFSVALTAGLVSPYVIGELKDHTENDAWGLFAMTFSLALSWLCLFFFHRFFLMRTEVKPPDAQQEAQVLLTE